MSIIQKKENANMGKNSIKKISKVAVIIVVVCLMIVFFYVNDYYPSEVSVEDYANVSGIIIEEMKDGIFVDGKGNKDAVVFYPGAKVEYTSYLPLCVKLAQEGVDCFLIEMPFHLAIFGMDKAEKIMESYNYENWYLAGHSLGGAMAANYVADNVEDFAGLIMLAAYPTKPLISEELKVISIYGNKDEIINQEKLAEGTELVPEHYTEISMGGANHAGFGNYGSQEGDGDATMEREKQQDMTVHYILKMIEQKYDPE